jgi:hypothetical protein
MKDVEEMAVFMVALANGAGQSLADGEINLTDIGNLMGALTKAPAAFEGVGNIPTQAAEMSEEDWAGLVETVKNQFDIPQDKVEGLVERALSLGKDLFSFVQELRGAIAPPSQ